MFTKRVCSICVAALLIAAGSASAISITTAAGNGADTYLSNDGQSAAYAPTATHGAERTIRAFRQLAATRSKAAYIRFDLGDATGDMSGATLTFQLTYQKGSGVVQVYGLKDGDGDFWDETTTSYNTAPGVIPNPPTALGNYALDMSKVVLLGTMTVPGTPAAYPLEFSSNPTDLPLADFLNADTNKLVTFIFIGTGSNEGEVASKENGTVNPPTLTLPNAGLGPKTSASGPSPADKATDVARDVVLSWSPGAYPSTHTVYFGTSFDDVNAGSVSVRVAQGQDANTYDPVGSLTRSQTYYWRIDEVNATPDATVHPGVVWSFTVELLTYPITGVTTSASSFVTGKGPENTINGSGLDTSTKLLHSTTDTGMWVSALGGLQPTYIQYTFDHVYKLTEMWVWNYNGDYEQALGLGVKNATIQYRATEGEDWTTLGNVDFKQGPATAGYAHNNSIPFGSGVAAKFVKITVNSGFGTTGQYGLSEVRFFYIPVLAQAPQPANNATGIAPDVTLSWRAGREAASHNVYLGTDPNVLTLAGTATTNSYAPANLSLGAKYYWRIDEVNTAEAITTWAGDVWSFSTLGSLTVDDMESYTNTDGNRIYQFWADGYGTTTNGSVVGYTTGTSYVETAIRHGGSQSMPFAYNNASGITNSEATRTFSPVQDWTKYGIKTLTLFFRGLATNSTTVPLWIKLTDQDNKSAKVTYGTSAADLLVLADPAWTTWSIPLSSLTGISVSKIKSMTIGVGNGTGSGTLYIDDIRLDPTTPAAVVAPTLAGWWKLDNNAQDSSGNGNNGTLAGTPAWVAAGKVGAALSLNGTTDYVDCGAGASLNITDTVTLSAWIKPTNLANSAYQTFVGKGDHAYNIQQTTGNLIQFYVYNGGWHNANSAAVTSTMNGAWHHVAGTYDGTQLRLYVDGAVVGSTLWTGAIASATHTVSIGRNSEATGRLYNGTIDEVRIYHGVLPTSEIVKLANP